MYMPGRLRTASKPSRTDRCLAVYASVAPGADDVPDEAVRVGTSGRSPSEAHPGRMPRAMPRGGTAPNPRLSMTNASTSRYLGTCPGRDTRCLCASGTAPEYRWDAGIVRHMATVGATLGLRVVSLVAYTTWSGERWSLGMCCAEL